MTDTDTLRALIVDALAAALEPLQTDIRELQTDVAAALDSLDRIEVDLRDVKAHDARVNRAIFKDANARRTIERRLSALERRVESLDLATRKDPSP